MTYASNTHPVTELTKALIARPSVTPLDEGCQSLMAERLAAASR